jgi:hypothetical protein
VSPRSPGTSHVRFEAPVEVKGALQREALRHGLDFDTFMRQLLRNYVNEILGRVALDEQGNPVVEKEE